MTTPNKAQGTGGARLLELLREGGAIVGSASCTPKAITVARARGHMWVDADGFGYVYMRSVYDLEGLFTECPECGAPDANMCSPHCTTRGRDPLNPNDDP